MKMVMKFGIVCLFMMLGLSININAQKFDEERMKRDIEVAENVLSTLLKQELNKQNSFFAMDIKGNYMPGYGVTFRLPVDFTMHMMAPVPPTLSADNIFFYGDDEDDDEGAIKIRERHEEITDREVEEEEERAYHLRDKVRNKKRQNDDSLRNEYYEKLIKASKDFIVDYGDFISQLGPNERIVITNQGDNRIWYFNPGKKRHISIEGSKADMIALKQGKISRDQALKKISVVNTESVDVKEPDMELMTSIFNRLYRSDLSKTFFTEDNIYYERLKDYGVIYYMQVFSSNQIDYDRFNMPTLGLTNVSREDRDKKIVEIYPKFEQEMKENILEYGRTLKSLKDDESLMFNVTLTKCKGCNIPSNVEFNVKSSVLKDFATGKIEKSAALNKISVKKGPNQ